MSKAIVMDLKDLKKGDPITTTQNSDGVRVNDEICYVNVGKDVVGVGAFLDGNDDCIAAIITEDGEKKVIGLAKDLSGHDEKHIMKELEEAYEVFND